MLTPGLSAANPLANDLALFDMYMAALDVVLVTPEIVIAFGEFGLSAARLRTRMVSEADRVLRTAAPEFAAYQQALARNADAVGIDPQTITLGSRRDVASITRLITRGSAVTGVALLGGGLASIWFWSPAQALIGAGASLLGAAGIVAAVQRAPNTYYGRMIADGIARSDDTIELKVARNRLMSAISQTELLAQVRSHINIARRGRFDDTYSVSSSPGLSEVYNSFNRVPTHVSADLEDLLERLDGGSIGVAGPRGSGKSMLIRQYCEDSGLDRANALSALDLWRTASDDGSEVAARDLRCMVAAPVDYAAQDFVLHLFAALCRAVVRTYGRRPLRTSRQVVDDLLPVAVELTLSLVGRAVLFGGAAAALWHWADAIASHLMVPPIWVRYAAVTVICIGAVDWFRSAVRSLRNVDRREEDEELVAAAKGQLTKVRYIQTYSSGLSGAVNLPAGVQAQMSRSVSRAEQPLSYPEIVDEFRSFAHKVAARAHDADARVFIGVDELDKIASAEQAERFLNEIKGIFGIPHVYFLVSVSDDALTAFERRGLPLRNAFDSSFDEIVHVGALSYTESRRLLYRRVVGLSEPYVALCHCLAGGLARDLIRAARHVVGVAAKLRDGNEPTEFQQGLDEAVSYLLLSDTPLRTGLTIGPIAEYVIRDELRRKIQATSHIADRLRPHDPSQLLELFYDAADRLLHGEPLENVIDPLTKPGPPEPAAIASLRLDIAVYAYYCGTLAHIFTGPLTSEQIVTATSEPITASSFDTLAAARNALAVDTALAWHLVSEFRAAWSLETNELPLRVLSRRRARSAPAAVYQSTIRPRDLREDASVSREA
jgi:hypothetical protein